jgi:hypothetical protein
MIEPEYFCNMHNNPRRNGMKFCKLLLIALAVAVIAPASGLAQKQRSCSRDGLKRMTDLYVAAQTKGDISGLPMAQGYLYLENMAAIDIEKSIVKKPVKIDFHRSIYDTATCQTFTEVIVTNKAEPYVIGARLRVVTDKITELETIWTTTGHWLFNADNYLKYSPAEKWDEIPVDKRDTRETLLYTANSYLDAFLDGNPDIVPWGTPCVRIEGGAYTEPGGEQPDSHCASLPGDRTRIGMPSGVNIANRRFVIDETLGSVLVLCTFGAGTPGGGSGSPDSHLFRIENGKSRYVHTLTHMLQSSFQGAVPKDGGAAKQNAKP